MSLTNLRIYRGYYESIKGNGRLVFTGGWYSRACVSIYGEGYALFPLLPLFSFFFCLFLFFHFLISICSHGIVPVSNNTVQS